jgi:Fic family protein
MGIGELMTAKTVRIGPGEVVEAEELPIRLNPDGIDPVRWRDGRGRWQLAPHTAGMMERLARARYEISKLIPGGADVWAELNDQAQQLTDGPTPLIAGLESEKNVLPTIAQSVYASSAIEGEAVYAKDASLAIVGHVDDREGQKEDYQERVKGAQAIYATYIWALTQAFPLAGNKVVTTGFIRELHRRMFSATKPHVAGKWKEKPNGIYWQGQYVLEMVAPDRVQQLLTALCDRISEQFNEADHSGRYSKLLAIAEFVLDFLAIHPFSDGNGRAARLLSTYLLERAGYHFARFYSLDSVILDRQQDYYRALFKAQAKWYSADENLTPWVDFYVSAIFAQWLRAHEEILKTVNGRGR